MYEQGHGVPQDDAKATLYYKRACDGGLALGCTNLGQLQRAGRAP
jgi:TPR repeat protein